MGTNLGWLVSKGFKRRLSALLTVLDGIVQTVPQAAPVLVFIQWAAGIFGVVGVAHAIPAGTVKKFKVLSTASVLATFVVLAQAYPPLLPFVPLVQKLAFILGVFGLAKNK